MPKKLVGRRRTEREMRAKARSDAAFTIYDKDGKKVLETDEGGAIKKEG